jgi:transcriptional regulator with XRE-family HTH domain
MTELSLQIGKLIRNKRIERNLSQESVALLSGIDRSYIGRIERGQVNITVEKLYVIAKVLDIPIKELLP